MSDASFLHSVFIKKHLIHLDLCPVLFVGIGCIHLHHFVIAFVFGSCIVGNGRLWGVFYVMSCNFGRRIEIEMKCEVARPQTGLNPFQGSTSLHQFHLISPLYFVLVSSRLLLNLVIHG